MTLDQIVKIQSIIDKRAIRSDTLEYLNKKRYSDSLEKTVRYGDMHIDHFLNVFFNNEKEENASMDSSSLESAVLMLTELLKNKYRKED